jgi:uncharacterized protein YjbJ (UPF0337 family)
VTQHENASVAGGALGKIAGKAKEAVGSVVGNEDLAREGRLQSAAVDAEADATRRAAEAERAENAAAIAEAKDEIVLERERLHAELAAETREERIEREAEAAKANVELQARRREQVIESAERAVNHAADDADRRAAQQRLDEALATARLEQEAHIAEATAEAIDPEETS